MDDMERLAEIVGSAIQTATAPLLARIAQLEKRALIEGPVGPAGAKGDTGASGEIGPQGQPGKDADMGLLLSLKGDVSTLQGEWLAFKAWQADSLTKALAGQPVVAGLSVEDVRPLITAEVATAVKAIELPVPTAGPAGPMGQKGDDGAPGRDGIDGKDGERGADGLPGKDGIDGKDGLSLTPDDLAPLVSAEVTTALSTLPSPRDGVGITGALIDRHGHLVLTLTDGGAKDVGPVMGKDVDLEDVKRIIREEVAKFPKPQDGINGKDGLGFDDLDLVFDPVNGYRVRFKREDQVKDYPVAIPWHAGVYESGRLYPKGAMLTHGGSLWTAHESTRERPPNANEPRLKSCAWRLCAKRGRDGDDKRK